jgi:Fe-S-cluster-containing dehydrogenase component
MACIVACLDQNDLPGTAHSFRHVSVFENGETAPPAISFLSLSCLHCGDAPCVMVCPTGSLQKREPDGIVTFNQDVCVGCHSCALACPFGAPQFPEGHKMAKCGFCHERIEAGLEPACVRVCPTRALRFGPVEKLTEETAKKASVNILKVLSLGAAGAGL